MSSTQYSIYIPRVFSNIDEAKIRFIFKNLSIGLVDRVDMIAKTNSKDEKYNMVFVWFSEWFNNSAAVNLREKIEDKNTQAKFVYDDPWYWILLPNTSKNEASTVENKEKKTEQPQQQQPMVQQPMMMMQHPMMMQQWPMYNMQPGYYPQWNMHIPPLVEAPYGHGTMTPYYGPQHGYQNPNYTAEDEAMMDELEQMMDREENA